MRNKKKDINTFFKNDKKLSWEENVKRQFPLLRSRFKFRHKTCNKNSEYWKDLYKHLNKSFYSKSDKKLTALLKAIAVKDFEFIKKGFTTGQYPIDFYFNEFTYPIGFKDHYVCPTCPAEYASHIADRDILSLLFNEAVKPLQNNWKIKDTKTKWGIIHYAALFNQKKAISEGVKEPGFDILLKSRLGCSALFIASVHGYLPIVKKLLNNGANHDKEELGFSLYMACKNSHKDIAKLLLKYGGDINYLACDTETPLYTACHKGHMDIVDMLINHGADVNKTNKLKGDWPPIFTACEHGHYEIVKKLINNGAGVDNISMTAKITPLYMACQNGHVDIVKLLLEKGADQNKVVDRKSNKIGHTTTPFAVACAFRQIEVVKLLLETKKAAVDFVSSDLGSTPLYHASQCGHEDIVKLLLENGAEPNHTLKADMNLSSLHVACQNGHVNVVKWLVKYGADIHKTIKNGITPLDLARRNHHESIVQFYLELTQKQEGNMKMG